MNDLRFACRQLLKNPGFTIVAVLTLSLGIGACTLVFSWIRSVLVEIVPGAEDPGRLVVLVSRHVSGTLGHTLSRMDIADLNAETKVFAGVIGSQMEAASLRVDREVEWAWAQPTTANFFDVLGVKPILGRGFQSGEDQAPRGNPVAVISHRLWQRRFGGASDVIGRTVEISRRPFTIIGVAPASFRGTMGGLGFDVWYPVTMSGEFSDVARALQSRGWRWLHTMARLRPGVTLGQAQSAVNIFMRRAEAEYPNSNRNLGVAVLPVWQSPYGAQSRLLPLLSALAAVAALLLLLVIANVGNLLLARATARENEMAVRAAMGARSTRLIRQTLVESLVLASVGGVLGCLLAVTFSRALLWFIPATYLPIALEFPVDAQVLGFTAATTIGTGLLFGLVPAWRASHANVAQTLRAGGRAGEGSPHSQRVRQALVVAEIAVALILLVAMTLCGRSFERARNIYVGLEPRGIWLAGFRLAPGAYTLEEAATFYRKLRSELAQLPGVESVALSDWLPLGFEGGSSTSFSVPGYLPAPGENLDAGVSLISPNYFATLKIPILSGREFDARDGPDGPRTIIINEQIARRYFADREPLGQTIEVWNQPRTVVGIARTGKYQSLNEPPRTYFYLPVDQIGDHSLSAVIRSRNAPAQLASAVSRLALSLDANAKPVAGMPMTQFMAAAYLIPQSAAILLSVLGASAVLLAALGIYGVIAWSVGRRVREVGVRMALGASRSEVAWLFLGYGMKLTVVAMVLGIVGSIFAGKILSNLLIEISTVDPLTYLVALGLLAAVVLFACWLPARRASHTEPMVALRTE